MKNILGSLSLSLFTILLFASFATRSIGDEHAEPKTLYDSIAMMDATWEDAYNHCKLDVMEEIISEDLEFYHDQGGADDVKEKTESSAEK